MTREKRELLAKYLEESKEKGKNVTTCKFFFFFFFFLVAQILAQIFIQTLPTGEFQQKLIISEKEVAALKSKLTKITLEKERLERKIVLWKEKALEDPVGKANAENIVNFAN